ncbi:MAG: T9SS type A sorting domain-containing protein [Bacteroidales bacterium]|nr:T9SS type A sorting domain-containing protein [Bacteroidales bacterium]
MKRFLLFFVLTIQALFLCGQSYDVLFIGNSYTEVNNLPQMVTDMAQSTGDAITYQAHTPGGCTFQQHVSGAAPLIQQGGWDYVVLQEQSQLPSFPINQFMNESYPYAQQLCQMIRQYNPEAKIVFYMTWGRKNGDQQNAPYYPPLGTYEGMDSLLFARYMMMAADNQAWVSPVGYVWHYIRDHYPDIELYSSDESHPSLIGTYAAACCFYTVFFQKNPQDITFDSSLEPAMTQIVKDVTRTLVYDSLSRWCMSVDSIIPEDSTAISDISVTMPQLWYNPATCQIVMEAENQQPFKLTLFSLNGQAISVYIGDGNESQCYFPVMGLSPGIYLIQYQTATAISTKKLFIGKS